MPRYFYKAKSLTGKLKQGIIEVSAPSELAKTLKQKGYFLLSAKQELKGVSGKKEKFGRKAAESLAGLFNVSLSEKLFFTKNLEVMLKTTVPLPRAFEILSEQAKTKKFKKALKKISEEIIKGQSLSDALGIFPDIFPKLYQETLKIGEETGRIEESLSILAQQMEREHNLKSKIKTAMVYPVVVLSVALIIGVVMFVVAVPKLKEAFQQLEVELPFTTRIFLSLSDLLSSKWYLFVAICFILVPILSSFFKKQKGSRLVSKIALNIPLISGIIQQINSTLMLRTLSSLLSAGVPIVRSLEIAGGSLGNFYFKQSLKEAAQSVEKGKKIYAALEPWRHIYSPMVLEMLKVGEETGETSRVLEELANFYEKEVSSSTQKLSSVIEPFLILIIGGIVGFFAVSMMQPMFSIMQKF